MANTRLTVVVRKDLQMPEGLLAAQVAHMADSFMRNAIINRVVSLRKDNQSIPDIFKPYELEWMKEPYLSILGVNSYEDLCEINEHAKREKLPVFEWKDLIPSPTMPDYVIRAFVGIAIGPADFDAIKIVTGKLPLY